MRNKVDQFYNYIYFDSRPDKEDTPKLLKDDHDY